VRGEGINMPIGCGTKRESTLINLRRGWLPFGFRTDLRRDLEGSRKEDIIPHPVIFSKRGVRGKRD